MTNSFLEQLAVGIILAVLSAIVVFIRRRWTFSGFMKGPRSKRNETANLLQRVTVRLTDIIRYYETDTLSAHPDEDNNLRLFAAEFLRANGELWYDLFRAQEFMTPNEKLVYAGHQAILRSPEVELCRDIHQKFEYGWLNRYVITKGDVREHFGRRTKAEEGVAIAKRFLEFCEKKLLPTLVDI